MGGSFHSYVKLPEGKPWKILSWYWFQPGFLWFHTSVLDSTRMSRNWRPMITMESFTILHLLCGVGCSLKRTKRYRTRHCATRALQQFRVCLTVPVPWLLQRAAPCSDCAASPEGFGGKLRWSSDGCTWPHHYHQPCHRLLLWGYPEGRWKTSLHDSERKDAEEFG